MAELKISPPPFPNRDEYPFVATVRFRKMVIDIENLDGSVREGKDPNGKHWKTNFRGAHYGEIRGSRGADGDPLDVYIKNPPDDKANKVFIIHQNHPRTHPTKAGQYDEDKVVFGVSSAEEAKALYLKHYNRKDFFRSVTEMSIEPFKRYAFGENKGEKVADAATAFIRMRLRGDTAMPKECKTPGEKIRSKGLGRGKARGQGKGPIGIPVGKEEKDMKKEATKQDFYALGYELGMKEKLAEIGGAAPGGPALTAGMTGAMPRQMPPRAMPQVNNAQATSAMNLIPKEQFPQHGGPVTSVQDVKAQMQPKLRPDMLKKNLTASLQ